MANAYISLPELISKNQTTLLHDWISLQRQTGAFNRRIKEEVLLEQSRGLLTELCSALQAGAPNDLKATEWSATRKILEEVSGTRTSLGFTPAETATFVFSLKEPIFNLLFAKTDSNVEKQQQEIWGINLLIDKLGLYTTEVAQSARENVIARQQQELIELSTPVVELWEGILALPLIGTLDSERTQVVMENLLERLVTSSAEFAIIDITGVPTVDTLVAQHLIKTVSAARLMGADCIISGIRPQIAQTIVHLGLELNVVSKATMADAFALALRRTGRSVEKRVASPKNGSL